LQLCIPLSRSTLINMFLCLTVLMTFARVD
jgi:hypothetical protein